MKGSKLLIGLAFAGLVFVTGCGQVTNTANNSSDAATTPVSTTNDVTTTTTSTAVSDWQQYASDTTDWVHQFMTIRSQYEQFIQDANKGHYDSTQIISAIGSMQTQLVTLKMNVDTYNASDTVYDTHQLFVKAVDDLYNAMQGISDAQVQQPINETQYKKDIANANNFSQRSSTEMSQYLTQETSQMKQAEGSGS